MRSLPTLLALLLATALVAAGCGGGDDNKKTESTAKPKPATAAQTDTAPAQAAGCKKVPTPKPKPEGKLSKPTTKLDPSKTYTATVDTSCGTFDIASTSSRRRRPRLPSPRWRDKRFYDDTVFHRISRASSIQGGDPTGTAQGGPGYNVAEAPPKDVTYTARDVAMAKTEIEEPTGTSGSQFFVVAAPARRPVLAAPTTRSSGKDSKGMDVVQAIAVPTGSTDQPLDPVVIQSVGSRARRAKLTRRAACAPRIASSSGGAARTGRARRARRPRGSAEQQAAGDPDPAEGQRDQLDDPQTEGEHADDEAEQIRSRGGAARMLDPGGGATRPMKRRRGAGGRVGGVLAEALDGVLEVSGRRSASASEALAMRRSCIRSCGRAAAIAFWKWARAALAS